MAAETAIAGARAAPRVPRRERALRGYPERLSAEYGGYYRLGMGFVAPDRPPRGDAASPPARAAATGA